MEALNLLLLLPVFFTLVPNTSPQQTYKQHCGCEYIINGKCAYTLLIPISSDAAGSQTTSCPTEGERHAIAGNGNVTKLTEMVGEAKQQISQLQSAVINVQNRAINESAFVQKLNDQQDRLLSFKDSLDQIFIGLNDVASSVAESHNHRHEEMQQFEKNLSDITEAQTSVAERLGRLESELNQLKEDVRGLATTGVQNGCQRRGLLVTRPERELPLEQIRVSSMYDASHGTPKVRINATGKPGSWCAFEPNLDYEWVQFDLGAANTPVLGVVTRGRADFPQWVTSYKLQYAENLPEGEDQEGWTVYKDVVGLDMIFKGNTDSGTPVTNMLWQPIYARYIRIWPLTKEKNMCMRADIIGCVDS